jgi:putative ABC transport system permease protein
MKTQRPISLRHFKADLFHGARNLSKNPQFSIPALITVALGIFICTVAFGIFNAVILKAMPYPNPDRMVALFGVSSGSGSTQFSLSRNEVRQIEAATNVFDHVGYYVYGGEQHLSVLEHSSQTNSLKVSPGFFGVFGTGPAIGREFSSEEFQPGGDKVVILGHSVWRQEFSSDRGAIGRTVRADGVSYMVVGVMPANFRFPTNGVQLWFPDTTPLTTEMENTGDKSTIARLKPGASIDSARAALAVVSPQARLEPVRRPYPDFTITAGGLREQVIGGSGRVIMLLFLAVALVQLIACANVASLFLARNAVREKDVAIKTALGASSWRIVQECMVESVLLSLVGGACGLGLAFWGVHLVGTLFAGSLANGSPLEIDFSVFCFSLLLSLISGVLIGTAPAFHITRLDPNKHLQQGVSGSGAGFGVRRGNRLQTVLVASQVTFALVLLISFGLLFKSLSRLLRVDLGFDPQHVLALQLGPSKLPQVQLPVALNQALDNVRRLPSVQSVAVATNRPLLSVSVSTLFASQTPAGNWTMSPSTHAQSVSPDYFRTLSIPILKGRSFTDQDKQDSRCVVIVSAALAHLLWSDYSPLERKIDLNGGMGPKPYICRVIGVAANVRDLKLEGNAVPEIYFDFLQQDFGPHALLVKTNGNAFLSVAEIMNTVHSADGSQDAQWADSLESVVNTSSYQPRLRATVLGAFTALAFLLAITGLYGLISYSVARRTKEIGIRMAVGATRTDILWLILGHCLAITSIGIGVGVGIALVITRSLQSMLFEVTVLDVSVYFAAAGVLVVVAMAASLVPAYRASALVPNEVLREG